MISLRTSFGRAALFIGGFLWILSAVVPGHAAEEDVSVASGTIHVRLDGGAGASAEASILQWARRSAQGVAAYIGAFPVKELRLIVRLEGEPGVHGGKTRAAGVPLMWVSVGPATTEAQFVDDWVLTHEMVHLSFPTIPGPHDWMEEGLATYVEPLCRLKTGAVSAERVWGDWIRDMPQGLPRSGDRGLDRTATWGRTYWGGALFYLTADLEIHRATGNQKGLGDVLAALHKEGVGIDQEWDPAKVFAFGDEKLGIHVLVPLYEKWATQPVRVDLDELWKSLGVRRRGGTVVFDDNAPLAAVRRAIAS